MTHELLLQILIGVTGGIGTFFLGLIAWGIKSLVMAVINNTKQMAVLSAKFEIWSKHAEEIPEMKKDLNALHSWRREVTSQGD